MGSMGRVRDTVHKHGASAYANLFTHLEEAVELCE